jgi:hypothetical protein
MQEKSTASDAPSAETLKHSYTLGADPGFANGAICLLSRNLKNIVFFDVKDDTLNDLSDFFSLWSLQVERAVLEKVNASPMMGVVSAFNFGRGYGWVEALLTNYRISYECVTPQKWLTVVGNRPLKEALPYDGSQKERDKIRRHNKKEGKQATFDWAKKKFPTAELRSLSKDSNRADALGIAYWGWQEYNKFGGRGGNTIKEKDTGSEPYELVDSSPAEE